VDAGYYALAARATLNLGVLVFTSIHSPLPYKELVTSLLQISKRVPLMITVSNPDDKHD
jgi:hypothetical protein